jgi:hypothetical protein
MMNAVQVTTAVLIIIKRRMAEALMIWRILFIATTQTDTA